jgi:hypothetical protein
VSFAGFRIDPQYVERANIDANAATFVRDAFFFVDNNRDAGAMIG